MRKNRFSLDLLITYWMVIRCDHIFSTGNNRYYPTIIMLILVLEISIVEFRRKTRTNKVLKETFSLI